jgi:hypothetical protein
MKRDRIYPEHYLDEINREWRQQNGMYDQCGEVFHAKNIERWSTLTEYRYLTVKKHGFRLTHSYSSSELFY